jgi:hypothetical protein
MNFKTIMIVNTEDPVSVAYMEYCAPSWDGFDLRIFNAITPNNLEEHKGLTFGRRNGGVELSDTEKACFYSQYLLWKKCAMERMPILVLEHDAYLEKPEWIKFDTRFDCTFYGQHAMEAVMYHPRFAEAMINRLKSNTVIGPMSFVDGMIGYLNKGQQSRFARPHARFMGRRAPVRSVIDPDLGTTVKHVGGTTADRAIKDRDLFKIVNLRNEGYYNE